MWAGDVAFTDQVPFAFRQRAEIESKFPVRGRCVQARKVAAPRRQRSPPALPGPNRRSPAIYPLGLSLVEPGRADHIIARRGLVYDGLFLIPALTPAPEVFSIPIHLPASSTAAGISTGSTCEETGLDNRIPQVGRCRSIPPGSDLTVFFRGQTLALTGSFANHHHHEYPIEGWRNVRRRRVFASR